MANSFIWKPSTINSWKHGVAFLADAGGPREAPTLKDSSGKSYNAKYINTNEGRHQWVFPSEVANMNDLSLTYNGQTTKIGKGSQSYEGNDFANLQARQKGSIGAGGGTGAQQGSVTGNGIDYTPGQTGFGVYPANLDPYYPDPSLIKYNPIEAAPYKYVDPQDVTSKVGEFNRGEIRKNFDLSRDIALQELDTELTGMTSFIPAASALKRAEAAKDNAFNQAEREAQVDSALPNARGDLEAQRGRAKAYAEGRAPDSITDRGLELSARSASADQSAAGGFGTQSSVARKSSDLMSAEQRIRLSQYGDQLLTGNINTSAALFLAPTQYSDAASQVRVTPEVGGARLQSGALSEVNNLTTLNPATAIQADINQNQFTTGLEQQTRQFNASNDLSAQQFNAQTQNQFALNRFAYRVGYAGTVAGAAQTDINTQLGIAQQGAARDIFMDQMAQTQRNNSLGALMGGLGTIAGAAIGGSLGGPAGAIIGAQIGGQAGGMIAGQSGGGGGGLSYIPSSIGGGNPNPGGVPGGTPPIVAPQPGTYSLGADTGPYNLASGSVSGYAPSAVAAAPVGSFFRDVGGMGADSSLVTRPNEEVTKTLLSASQPVLEGAGVSNTPQPQAVDVGVNNFGRPVYMNAALLRSTDSGMGGERVQSAGQVLAPFGVFGEEDGKKFADLASPATDPNLIATLDQHAQDGNLKDFVNTLQDNVGSHLSDDENVVSKFAGYQLGQNWGQMSPAQKSLGIASLAIQNFKFNDGNTIATKPLVKDANGKTELSLKDGINLLQSGVNAYPLVNKYDQYKRLNTIASGGGDGLSVAGFANNLGLLGIGTKGAAVPGVTTQKLAANGWTPVPHLGVGAVMNLDGRGKLPAGYEQYKLPNGNIVAAPKSNISTSRDAISNSLVSTAGGDNGTSQNAVKIYQGWGQAPSKNQGVEGGSALAGGLSTMAQTNPYLLGGVVGADITKNVFSGGGKSADQKARDGVRSAFKSNGLIDNNYNLSLADGSKVNVGIDGKGGMRGNLHSYDIDYTNDLDYAAGMGGTALSRLISGKSDQATDQFGGQLGNASLSNVGYGKEFSEENFGKTQSNLKAMYAQSGIKSKADGYQLANQAYSEGRIDETGLTTIQQSLNMVFDKDGFQTAQKLMAGRHRGIETSGKEAASSTPGELDRNGVQKGYRAQLPTLPAWLEKWVDRGNGYPGDSEKRKKPDDLIGKDDIAIGLIAGPGAAITNKIRKGLHL